MKKTIGLLILLSTIAGILVACGSTPAPTEPAPTQTPRVVVVTTTPYVQEVVEVEVSPEVMTVVVTATPTKGRPATAEPTQAATESPEATAAEPTETTPPETTPTQTPRAGQPTPTRTPSTSDFKYPPPVLLDPPNNRPVSWRSTVLLKWSPVGELTEDEYYHVHLERPPKAGTEQEWYGDYVYTKDTQFLVEDAFLAPFHLPQEQGHGVVYWWVRVVRKTGEDDSGKPIGIDVSPPSEKRTFITEPKPE